jgi:hypothetical protein
VANVHVQFRVAEDTKYCTWFGTRNTRYMRTICEGEVALQPEIGQGSKWFANHSCTMYAALRCVCVCYEW